MYIYFVLWISHIFFLKHACLRNFPEIRKTKNTGSGVCMDGGGGCRSEDAVQGRVGGEHNREKTYSISSRHGVVVKATAFQCGIPGI